MNLVGLESGITGCCDCHTTTFSREKHRVLVFMLPLLMAWISKDLDHKLTRGLDQLASGSVGSGSFSLKQLKLQSDSCIRTVCT